MVQSRGTGYLICQKKYCTAYSISCPKERQLKLVSCPNHGVFFGQWTHKLTIYYSERSPLFNGTHRTRLFISRVSNALQAYLDHNHRIEGFHLVLTSSKSISLLENWIPMLTAIGVKELLLHILPRGNRKPISYVDLPSVFFKAESLKRLHLFRCNLGQQSTSPDQRILFDCLNVLRLHSVNFTNEDIFDKIISSCRFITSMWFQECPGLKSIKLVHKYLKHFTFINEYTYRIDKCSIEIHVITLETININGSQIRFYGHTFSNLKNLSLSRMKSSSNSFSSSSCHEFPHLQILSFYDCFGLSRFQLCINAPKISCFQFTGSTIPSITFEPTSREYWRSEINIWLQLYYSLGDVPSWFLRLSGLLQELSKFENFLSVAQNPRNIFNIQQDIINTIGANCKTVAVEQLGLNMGHLSSFPHVLNGLFCICRPRDIAPTEEMAKVEKKDRKEITEFLCKFLMKRDSDEFSRQEDLEELSIECFDTSREQWQSTMMSECEALPESNRIRFRLKWRQACELSSNKLHKLEF